jgi:hypothetical protein
MVARALRTLLPAVVLLAAPLYLFAHVSLTQRESRGLTVQTDAAEQPVHVGQGGAAPRVQLNFYGEALCPGTLVRSTRLCEQRRACPLNAHVLRPAAYAAPADLCLQVLSEPSPRCTRVSTGLTVRDLV